MGRIQLGEKEVTRYYHFLISPIGDWNNDRAKEYVSTGLNPYIEGWKTVAVIGYHDK